LKASDGVAGFLSVVGDALDYAAEGFLGLRLGRLGRVGGWGRHG
jgi:hypothetical protein